MLKLFSFWTDMDNDRKAGLIRYAGFVVAGFAAFTLLATMSYIFTWSADQSLLSDPEMMDSATQVHNSAGKLGFRWAHLLVDRWFGLASLVLVFSLAVLAVRMILGRRKFSVVKVVLSSILGAVLASFILAYLSSVFGLKNTLGQGLGGGCGAYVSAWLTNLFGSLLTCVILILLSALWLLFSSRRFSIWFAKLGTGMESKARKEKKEKKSAAEAATFNFGPKVEPSTELTSGTSDVNPATDGQPNGDSETVAVPVVEEGGDGNNGGDGENGNFNIQVGDNLSTDVTKELPPIDVRADLENYKFPSLDILKDYASGRHEVSQEELRRNNYKIRATLKTYKIELKEVTAVVGPTVTLYKLYPEAGVKIASIENCQKEIAMGLNVKDIRIFTLPDAVGIEVANDKPSIVPLRAMLNDDLFRESKAELPVAVGYSTITQKVKVFDLADAPHVLMAGATKQGKSVGLNVIISSLLYKKHPSELKFVFIDPKMVEFSSYADLLHHYLAVLPTAADGKEEEDAAIVKTQKGANDVLGSLCIEMDERYKLMSQARVNKVTLYNEKFKSRHLLPTEGHRFLPYIVVIIDEYADLTMGGAGSDAKNLSRGIATSIIRLAQKGRAAGLHIVLATQRPSVDVITGMIKTNFPTRIAFRVVSRVDSQTILDSPGAEKLIGKGDMLYYDGGVNLERVQCAMIGGDEISSITGYIKSQQGYKKSYNTPYYLPMPPDSDNSGEGGGMIDMSKLDDRFEEAARMVVTTQRGSTTDLQRRLGMGYARAGSVMDQLEAAGVVGPQEGSKPRKVLVGSLDELDDILEAFLHK